MTSKHYLSLLKFLIQLGCGYMVFESLLHASGVRLLGVEEHWPESAVVFVHLFIWLWASLSLFTAVVLFYCFKYFEQAKPLLVMLSFPAFIHGIIVLWLSFTPYTQILPTPSLYVWLPFYPWALRGEAASLFLATGFLLYGRWKKYL